MATSGSCYSADQVLDFLDESVEEGEPYMEGSDEYDDLVDTSNGTDNLDEFDENMSMSSVPTDPIFTYHLHLMLLLATHNWLISAITYCLLHLLLNKIHSRLNTNKYTSANKYTTLNTLVY